MDTRRIQINEKQGTDNMKAIQREMSALKEMIKAQKGTLEM